jgi:hypothetical protein
MKNVEIYGQVRYAVQIEGLSKRAAARRFGIDPKTVAKMRSFSVPPGYVRTKPPVRPKLDPFIAIIDKILADDKSQPKKQRICFGRSDLVSHGQCTPSKASLPPGASAIRYPVAR